MINTLYLHGFASTFNENSQKIKTLKKYFNIIPFSYDSSAAYKTNLEKIKSFIVEKEIKIVIGSSLGGFYTIQATAEFPNILGVALNPAISPRSSLSSFEGERMNYETKELFLLSKSTINSYPDDCKKNGRCLVYLTPNDELLDSSITYEKLQSHFKCTMLPNGGHRFDDISQEIIEDILLEYESNF